MVALLLVVPLVGAVPLVGGMPASGAVPDDPAAAERAEVAGGGPASGGVPGTGDVSTADSAPAAGTALDGGGRVQGDWQVLTAVEVHEDGTADVTMTVNRSVGVVRLKKKQVVGLEIHSGEQALTEASRGKIYEWDTDQTQRIEYSVDLGNLQYGSSVLRNSIIFRTSEIMPFKRAMDHPEPDRRLFEIRPPGEWSAIVPGQKVGTNTYRLAPRRKSNTNVRDFIAVGDFSVTTASANGETIRVATLPSASGPSHQNITDLLLTTTPIVEELTGVETEYPRSLVVVPSGMEKSGAALHSSLIMADNRRLYDVERSDTVYVHELVHTYQQTRSEREMSGWIEEGGAEYLSTLALQRAGFITEAEFRHIVRIDVTGGRDDEIGDPIEKPAAASPYKKGAAVMAALDMDVRARTGGAKTIADFYSAINALKEESERGVTLTKGEVLGVLESVTGEDYTTFYANYVESTAFPDVLLTEEFSLSDPVPVDHGTLSETQRLRQRVDRLEEQVDALQQRLDEKNETIRELRRGADASTPEDDSVRRDESRAERLERRLEATRRVNRIVNVAGLVVIVALAGLLIRERRRG